jgi:hypothetical protein
MSRVVGTVFRLWVRKFGRTSQNIRFAGKTEFTHPTGLANDPAMTPAVLSKTPSLDGPILHLRMANRSSEYA